MNNYQDHIDSIVDELYSMFRFLQHDRSLAISWPTKAILMEMVSVDRDS